MYNNVSTASKERVAKKYHDLVFIIHHFGRNLMWGKHLLEFVQLFNPKMTERRFSEALQELQRALIIDVHHFQNRKILKLKKYGICYLNDTPRSKTGSPTFSTNKVLRNVHIAYMILSILQKKKNIAPDLTIHEALKFIQERSTLLAKDKHNHHVIKNLFIPKVKHDHNKKSLSSEIERLKAIRKSNLSYLHTERKTESKAVKKEYSMSLNSMQSRDVYLYGSRNRKKNGIQIFGTNILIMDIQGKYRDEKRLIQLMKDIDTYIGSFFLKEDFLFQINFLLVVESEEREEYYLNHTALQQYLDEPTNLNSFVLTVVNSNLKEELFGNGTIIA